MLRSILEFFRAIFNNPVIKNDLEAYISSGNPKDAGDVEKLEKEFAMQRKHLCRYYGE